MAFEDLIGLNQMSSLGGSQEPQGADLGLLAKQELARKIRESELQDQELAIDEAKAKADRDYLSRDLVTEAKQFEKDKYAKMSSPKRALAKYWSWASGVSPADKEFEKQMELYKAQAPVRQRDIANYETNRFKKAQKEAELAARVEQNQRVNDIAIQKLAQGNSKLAADFQHKVAQDNNLKAAAKLLDQRTYQTLLENKFMETYGQKMNTMDKNLGAASVLSDSSNPNVRKLGQTFANVTDLLKGKSGSGQASVRTTTSPDRRQVKTYNPNTGQYDISFVDIGPKTTTSSYSPVDTSLGLTKGQTFMQNQFGVSPSERPSPTPTTQNNVPITNRGPVASIEKQAIAASVPATKQNGPSTIFKYSSPVKRTATEEAAYQSLIGLNTNYTNLANRVMSMGPQKLKQFIGAYGKGSDMNIALKRFMGSIGMDEQAVRGETADAAWKQALAYSGKALNSTELKFLEDIAPNAKDTSIDMFLEKMIKQKIALSIMEARTRLFEQGKITKNDIAKMNMSQNVNKASRAMVAMIINGQNPDIEDMAAPIVHPELWDKDSNRKSSLYYMQKRKNIDDLFNQLNTPQQAPGILQRLGIR